MKYKIISHLNGYKLYYKKHFYNKYKKFDNSYWVNLTDLINYILKLNNYQNITIIFEK